MSNRNARFSWDDDNALQIVEPGTGKVLCNFDEMETKAADADRPTGDAVECQGVKVAVENAVGSQRRGIAADGKSWSVTFAYPYGYIPDTVGADGDSIDAFVGPNKRAKKIYVIHQNDLDGYYDEAKVMLGFDSAREAKQAYWEHYDRPEKFFRSLDVYTTDAFKKELEANDGKLA